MAQSPLNYRDAGVDIDAGNRLVERIKPLAARTHGAGVLGGLGGFGGLFELPTGYRNPVLVSGTDGVGTKLKLGLAAQQHYGLGIDLVAMCVNDIVVCGANPLFFLDYYATGKLSIDAASEVIAGIAEGCTRAGAALLGGETAEMPGLYGEGEYDLAGFCVGIVEKSRLIDGSTVRASDTLIALASSGAHSNGYSLIRKILARAGDPLDTPFADRTLGAALLEPTRIYVRTIHTLIDTLDIRAIAHITGGGLTENLPRVLPDDVQARIDLDSWALPELFVWLQEQGGISDDEMRRTFNCGIGMVLCVPSEQAERALGLLESCGEKAWRLGDIGPRAPDQPPLVYRGGS